MTYDVIVIGAGYIGCAVAYHLAAAGLRTALLDQGGVAAGASRANYGNVQVQDAELSSSLPLVKAGYDCFERLAETLGQPVGFRRLGSLLLLETEAQWQILAGRLPALHAAGIRAELVPAERLPELEPLLDPRAVLGACYHPDEGQIYPFSLMWAYLRPALRLGLALHTETGLTGFRLAGGRLAGVQTRVGEFSAGTVVLCTGAWTPALGRLLGRRWAIQHVHGQALVTEATGQRLNNHIASAAFFEEMHGESAGQPGAVLALAQAAAGNFLLGEAGIVTGDLGSRVTLAGQAAIAAVTGRFFPALRRLRVLRGWAAPVAFTADGRPFLGPVADLPGLILATAFKSTAVVTPLVGRLVAQLVVEGRAELDLSPFSPDREMACAH